MKKDFLCRCQKELKGQNQRLTPEAFRDRSSRDSIDRKIGDIYEKYQETKGE